MNTSVEEREQRNKSEEAVSDRVTLLDQEEIVVEQQNAVADKTYEGSPLKEKIDSDEELEKESDAVPKNVMVKRTLQKPSINDLLANKACVGEPYPVECPTVDLDEVFRAAAKRFEQMCKETKEIRCLDTSLPAGAEAATDKSSLKDVIRRSKNSYRK